MANDNVLNRLEQTNLNTQSISKYSSPILEMLHANVDESSQSRVATQNTLSVSAKYYTQSLQLTSQLVSNTEKILNLMASHAEVASSKGAQIVGSASSAGMNINTDKYSEPPGLLARMTKAGEIRVNKEIDSKATSRMARSMGMPASTVAAIKTSATAIFGGLLSKPNIDPGIATTVILMGIYDLTRKILGYTADSHHTPTKGGNSSYSSKSIISEITAKEKEATSNYTMDAPEDEDKRTIIQKIDNLPLVGRSLAVPLKLLDRLVTLPTLVPELKLMWTKFKDKNALQQMDYTAQAKQLGLYKNSEQRAFDFLGGRFIDYVDQIASHIAIIAGQGNEIDNETGRRLGDRRSDLYDAVNANFFTQEAVYNKDGQLIKFISAEQKKEAVTQKREAAIAQQYINKAFDDAGFVASLVLGPLLGEDPKKIAAKAVQSLDFRKASELEQQAESYQRTLKFKEENIKQQQDLYRMTGIGLLGGGSVVGLVGGAGGIMPALSSLASGALGTTATGTGLSSSILSGIGQAVVSNPQGAAAALGGMLGAGNMAISGPINSIMGTNINDITDALSANSGWQKSTLPITDILSKDEFIKSPLYAKYQAEYENKYSELYKQLNDEKEQKRFELRKLIDKDLQVKEIQEIQADPSTSPDKVRMLNDLIAELNPQEIKDSRKKLGEEIREISSKLNSIPTDKESLSDFLFNQYQNEIPSNTNLSFYQSSQTNLLPKIKPIIEIKSEVLSSIQKFLSEEGKDSREFEAKLLTRLESPILVSIVPGPPKTRVTKRHDTASPIKPNFDGSISRIDTMSEGNRPEIGYVNGQFFKLNTESEIITDKPIEILSAKDSFGLFRSLPEALGHLSEISQNQNELVADLSSIIQLMLKEEASKEKEKDITKQSGLPAEVQALQEQAEENKKEKNRTGIWEDTKEGVQAIHSSFISFLTQWKKDKKEKKDTETKPKGFFDKVKDAILGTAGEAAKGLTKGTTEGLSKTLVTAVGSGLGALSAGIGTLVGSLFTSIFKHLKDLVFAPFKLVSDTFGKIKTLIFGNKTKPPLTSSETEIASGAVKDSTKPVGTPGSPPITKKPRKPKRLNAALKEEIAEDLETLAKSQSHRTRRIDKLKENLELKRQELSNQSSKIEEIKSEIAKTTRNKKKADLSKKLEELEKNYKKELSYTDRFKKLVSKYDGVESSKSKGIAKSISEKIYGSAEYADDILGDSSKVSEVLRKKTLFEKLVKSPVQKIGKGASVVGNFGLNTILHPIQTSGKVLRGVGRGIVATPGVVGRGISKVGKFGLNVAGKLAVPLTLLSGLQEMGSDYDKTGSIKESLFGGMRGGGIDNVLKGMSKYGAMGTAAGMMIPIPGIGAVAGGIIGTIVGGIIGYFGSDKVSAALSNMGKFFNKLNYSIADKFAMIGPTAGYMSKLGAQDSFIPIFRPFIMGILGAVGDGILKIGDLFKSGVQNAPDTVQMLNYKIADLFKGNKYAEPMALDWMVFPIIGPLVGGLFGYLVSAVSSVFSFFSMPDLSGNFSLANKFANLFASFSKVGGEWALSWGGNDNALMSLLGGILGSVWDGIKWIIGSASFDEFGKKRSTFNDQLIAWFKTINPESGEWSVIGSGVPIIGTLAGGILGGAWGAIKAMFTSQSQVSTWAKLGIKFSMFWDDFGNMIGDSIDDLVHGLKKMWYDLTGQDSEKLTAEWDTAKQARKAASEAKINTTLKQLAEIETRQIEERKKERAQFEMPKSKTGTATATPKPPPISSVIDSAIQTTTQPFRDGEFLQGASDFKDKALDSVEWLGNSISMTFKSMTVLFLGMVDKLSGWFKNNAPDYYNNEIKPALESAQNALKEYGGKAYDFTANTAIPAMSSGAKTAYNYASNGISAVASGIKNSIPNIKYYGYYTPRGISSGILGTGQYDQDIQETEQLYHIPQGTIKAIIAKESNGNPKAVSPADNQGLHGWGLGQFRNATAQEITQKTGIPIWQGNRVNMDPKIQIRAMGALLTLKKKAVTGHSWDDAIWAYNAGEGTVNNVKAGKGYGKLAGKVDPNYQKEVLANRDAIVKSNFSAVPAPQYTTSPINTSPEVSNNNMLPPPPYDSENWEEPRTPSHIPGKSVLNPAKDLTGLTFAPGVDTRIGQKIADKIKLLQKKFGRPFLITSGFRDESRNHGAKDSAHLRGNAIDISNAGLTNESRVKLIDLASSIGIGGIGVYNSGSMHFDVENRRIWGGRGQVYSRRFLPPYAEQAAQRHEQNKRGGSSIDSPTFVGSSESSDGMLDKGMKYVDQATGKVMDSIGVPDATVGGVASTIMGGIKGFIRKLETIANLSRQGENRENVQSLLSAFGIDNELGIVSSVSNQAFESQSPTPLSTTPNPPVNPENDPSFVGPKLVSENDPSFVGPKLSDVASSNYGSINSPLNQYVKDKDITTEDNIQPSTGLTKVKAAEKTPVTTPEPPVSSPVMTKVDRNDPLWQKAYVEALGSKPLTDEDRKTEADSLYLWWKKPKGNDDIPISTDNKTFVEKTPVTTPEPPVSSPVMTKVEFKTGNNNLSVPEIQYEGKIETIPSPPPVISDSPEEKYNQKIREGIASTVDGQMYYDGKYYKKHGTGIIFSSDMRNWEALPEEKVQMHSITPSSKKLAQLAESYARDYEKAKPMYTEILNDPKIKDGLNRNRTILSEYSQLLGLDLNKLLASTVPVEIKRPNINYEQVKSVSARNYDDMVSRAEPEVENKPKAQAQTQSQKSSAADEKPPIIINQNSTSNGVVNAPDTTNKIIKFDPEVDELVSQLFAATSNAFKKEIYLFGTGISI